MEIKPKEKGYLKYLSMDCRHYSKDVQTVACGPHPTSQSFSSSPIKVKIKCNQCGKLHAAVAHRTLKGNRENLGERAVESGGGRTGARKRQNKQDGVVEREGDERGKRQRHGGGTKRD